MKETLLGFPIVYVDAPAPEIEIGRLEDSSLLTQTTIRITTKDNSSSGKPQQEKE